MHRKMVAICLLLLVLFGIVIAGQPTVAQSSSSYNLEWHVIGGGGHPVSSTSYSANSTIGQSVASPPSSSSTNYTVNGGYWFTPLFSIYMPTIHK